MRKNVHIAEKCNFMGIENISRGEGSSLGRGSALWTTRAKICIGKKVLLVRMLPLLLETTESIWLENIWQM